MKVWLAKDPETERIALQTREFADGDLPRGKRGRGWLFRESELDEDTLRALLAGEIPPETQDELHQELWVRGS